MLDDDKTTAGETSQQPATGAEGPAAAEQPPAKKAAARKTAARKTAAKKTAAPKKAAAAKAPAKKAAAKKTAAQKSTAQKSTAQKSTAQKSTAQKTSASRTRKAATAEPTAEPTASAETGPTAEELEPTAGAATVDGAAAEQPGISGAVDVDEPEQDETGQDEAGQDEAGQDEAQDTEAAADGAAEGEAAAEGIEGGAAEATPAAAVPLFQAPTVTTTTRRRRATKPKAEEAADTAGAAEPSDRTGAGPADRPEDAQAEAPEAADTSAAAGTTAGDTGDAGDAGESGDEGDQGADQSSGQGGSGRRRRRRGGRRRRKNGEQEGGETTDESVDGGPDAESEEGAEDTAAADAADADAGTSGGSRRRRRRRRAGEDGGDGGDDPENTVTRVRKARSPEDEITAVTGSTRLEAKKQRRREGREAGRRRAPIVSEAEFLARRESVERTMVVRQRDDLTQIAVLEDKVLVEHYVARESQTSLIGNVYLGRVQNVLPSMEAAFIDIGKGRNAVLYAGEVNWSALGHKDGQPRKIESVLSSGQSVLVQVTKDPVGHKGARLTSQVSLAGRFLVYVPDGTTSGISRKLPDTERSRLKTLLKEIVPDGAGVIVRTAAEGASEDELTRDVERLKARWEDIEKGAKTGSAPKLLYGEPDLTLKVVRDLFTEDFSKLVVQGDDAWETVQPYVAHVAPDLEDRLERFEPTDGSGDAFATYRIDEQIAKGLDRKVWLPSGGSLIIDRTEAMTVVDVNTGKFTGSGGNLEETVTKNNLEAAEEIVRQLRLRDIGGIIVVDFIDMVLESNRDLVLRRLVECLGRDRTRHQVAEVTSLGLVQMTRKRIGTGLLEAFSETCEHCQGRGLVVHDMPVEPKKGDDDGRRGGRRRGRGKSGEATGGSQGGNGAGSSRAPSPKDVAAMARPENAERQQADEAPTPPEPAEQTTPDTGDARPEVTGPEVTGPEATGPEATGPEATGTDEPDAATGEEPAASTGSRGRGRGSRRKPAVAEPAVAPAADDRSEAEPAEPAQPVAADRTDSAEPAPDAVPPTGPVEPAPPAPPKVVTRTRRRAASRPAGPPAGVTGDGSASAGATSGTGSSEVPSLADVPPVGGVGSPASDGRAEPGVAAHEPGNGTGPAEPETPAAELHVPIKKKGSRKR